MVASGEIEGSLSLHNSVFISSFYMLPTLHVRCLNLDVMPLDILAILYMLPALSHVCSLLPWQHLPRLLAPVRGLYLSLLSTRLTYHIYCLLTVLCFLLVIYTCHVSPTLIHHVSFYLLPVLCSSYLYSVHAASGAHHPHAMGHQPPHHAGADASTGPRHQGHATCPPFHSHWAHKRCCRVRNVTLNGVTSTCSKCCQDTLGSLPGCESFSHRYVTVNGLAGIRSGLSQYRLPRVTR